jgi:3-oxoacyl-[acyl-carrier protein] reductase
MDLGIRGRKALGASAGMGKQAALALSREGAKIFITARGESRLADAAREIIDATGADVRPVVADHSTAQGRRCLLEACSDPDILIVNCTPPRSVDGYQDVSEDELKAALLTTFVGPIELMRMFVPGMAERGFGRVINISTGSAKYPMEIRLLSGPARAALRNYTAAVARRVASRNVAINCVLPGAVHTEGSRAIFEARAAAEGTTFETVVQKFIEEIDVPAGRFGDAADIGALCAMLSSQYASYIIGQSIVIDGGVGRSVF